MQISPNKVIQARLSRVMSQEELAVACTLSARTIQRVEAGQAASLETTKALLAVLGPEILEDPVAPGTRHGPSAWRSFALQAIRRLRAPTMLAFDALRAVLALAFLLVALAKPLMPTQAGLFMDPRFAGLGLIRNPPAGSHDVLGYGLVPLMVGAAVGVLLSIGRVREILRRELAVRS